MNHINSFQRELLQKIQNKTTAKISLDTFLFKAFKFFDLNNNGCLKKNDFFRAIAKCGVAVDSEVMDIIYQHYSKGNDFIYFPKFVEDLAYKQNSIESNGSRVKISSVKSQKQQFSNDKDNKFQPPQKQLQSPPSIKSQSRIIKITSYADVLEFIKQNIKNDGLGSLLSVAVKCKALDSKKTHLINKKQLAGILPFLNQQHLDFIYKELSQNHNEIDFSTFVYDLKGSLQQSRVLCLADAFNYLDTHQQGQFEIEYFLSRYLSKRSFQSFRNAVNLYVKFQGIDDGVFTQDDFHDFMGFLSFDFPSQEQFKNNIIKHFYQEERSVISQKSNRSRDFQLKQEKSSVKQISQYDQNFKKNKNVQQDKDQIDSLDKVKIQKQPSKKTSTRFSHFSHQEGSNQQLSLFQSIVLRIRKRLGSKGTKGFLVFQKALKAADTNHDTLLNFQQFREVIREQRIDITHTECNSIFDLFDNEGTGSISLSEFLYYLRGKTSQNRKILSDKIWNQVKVSQQETSLYKIKQSLNFRNHPDVQTGRRYQDDIWKQIQETIAIIQELNGNLRSSNITKNQFEEYLQSLSLSIQDDKLFQSYLFNFWKLDTSSSILDQYAGSRKLFLDNKNGYLMDHHRNYLKGGSVSQNAPFGTFQEPTSYRTQHNKL